MKGGKLVVRLAWGNEIEEGITVLRGKLLKKL